MILVEGCVWSCGANSGETLDWSGGNGVITAVHYDKVSKVVIHGNQFLRDNTHRSVPNMGATSPVIGMKRRHNLAVSLALCRHQCCLTACARKAMHFAVRPLWECGADGAGLLSSLLPLVQAAPRVSEAGVPSMAL